MLSFPRAARAVVLSALVTALLVPATSSVVAADEPERSWVMVVGPVSDDPEVSFPVVRGPFEAVVEVRMGDQHSITAELQLPTWMDRHQSLPPQTVTRETCPTTCRLTWQVDPASETTAWFSGWSRLDVAGTGDAGPVEEYGIGLVYMPPVASVSARTTATTTPNTPGYPSEVLDTGGEVVVESTDVRDLDETVVVTLLPQGAALGSTPIARLSTRWDLQVEGSPAVARVRLDTAGLSEGRYRLVAQAHDPNGRWSFASVGGIVVRHRPLVVVSPAIRAVAKGRVLELGLEVNRPWSGSRVLGGVRMAVGGVTSVLSTSWVVPQEDLSPAQAFVAVPTASLPLGRHTVRVDVLDTTGASLGAPQSMTLDVVDFREALTVPTLVVGKAASVRVTATAPPGLTIRGCSVTLVHPLLAQGTIDPCAGSPGTSVDARTQIQPEHAGTARMRLELFTREGGIGPVREVPVTVHVNRTAILSAPGSAKYGTTQTATVTVTDEKTLRTVTRAPSGVKVTLQRKVAGTTTWTTAGTGTTDSTGRAAIRFTNSANGRLRALVVATVPGGITSAERSIWSTATVAWSPRPTAMRSGATLTAAVYAKPYEKGAFVRLQARKVGASSWSTFGSGAVGTSGYAKATARLYSRGDWEVRVVRVGTTRQATGYSSVTVVDVR